MARSELGGTPDSQLFSLVDVLQEELSQLRPDSLQGSAALRGDNPPRALPPYSTKNAAVTRQGAADALRGMYERIHKLGAKGTVALCLSGGGIRSATFNLGVLQALA